MKNGFIFQEDEFEFTGTGQLSLGEGLDVSQRFSYDYSKKPQSIAYRRKNTAKTGSVSIAFNHLEVENIFDEIARYESIAGQVGEFYWNGRALGQFLIKSVQLSLGIDGIDIISNCQIGLEIQEGYKAQKAGKSNNIVLKDIALI